MCATHEGRRNPAAGPADRAHSATGGTHGQGRTEMQNGAECRERQRPADGFSEDSKLGVGTDFYKGHSKNSSLEAQLKALFAPQSGSER